MWPFFLLLIILILAEYGFIKVLGLQEVTDLTQNLNFEKKDLIGLFTNLLTVTVNIAVAAVVFYQNKKINDLKATILGTNVEEIRLADTVRQGDADFVLQQLFERPPLTVSQRVSDQNHEFWIHLRIGNKAEKNLSFPIAVKTESTHTVTELRLQKISCRLYHKGEKLKKLTIKTPDVSMVKRFQKQDQVLFSFGLTLDESIKADKLETVFCCQFIHQNGYRQKMRIQVTFESMKGEEPYYITSSSAN